ncbi:MAG TPA: hypothetical protein V6C52_01925 [Coleofasciculaceae cyanobacterium]|jgi:hypothetical protein
MRITFGNWTGGATPGISKTGSGEQRLRSTQEGQDFLVSIEDGRGRETDSFRFTSKHKDDAQDRAPKAQKKFSEINVHVTGRHRFWTTVGFLSSPAFLERTRNPDFLRATEIAVKAYKQFTGHSDAPDFPTFA